MSYDENDIRPVDLDVGKFKARDADLKRLQQRKADFVQVPCPACGSDRAEHEFIKFDFNFDRCSNCETVFMTPRATPEILADFYANSMLYKYWNDYIFPASRGARQEHIFRPRMLKIIDACRDLGINTGTLMEVGAATGMFCEEALKTGAFDHVIAVEPGRAQAETCRALSLEVIESTIEQITGMEQIADVIVSFETIEHLYSPTEFLKQCRRFLQPKGLLVLTCPNYKGFDIATLGSQSESLDAEHINMFNPESLKLLVERAGFTVVEVSTPGALDADIVRRCVLDGSLSLEGQAFLKTILIEKWDRLGEPFQAFLSANLLSSHMWLVARASL